MKNEYLFVPVLAISSGVTDIDFYKKAFGATESWRISNPDGSVHVASFSIGEAMFRLHEENREAIGANASLSPGKAHGTTVTIALQADDVRAVIAQAIAAGAMLASPVKDYEYGYRQGEVIDPFGHRWLIEKLLSKDALMNFVNNL